MAECDAVVTSGGVSMGDFDYVKVVLDRLGDMRWMQVAIKPAKPFAFGTIDGTPVFGLPGNPVSSMVSFELFARPALRRMMGHPTVRLDRPRVRAVADEDFARRPDGKTHFARVVAAWPTTAASTCAPPAARAPTCCGPWPWPTRWPSSPTATASRRAATSRSSCRRWWKLMARRDARRSRSRRPVSSDGRVRDLRISVTDRCNFRCTYCMPDEGMEWLPRDELLTFEEIERVARVCVERFGFDGIRLTGGEPTVRAHLPVLVEKLAALGVDLAMTTNGATLRLLAHDLRAAGLQRVNISLDSLRRDRFVELTRRDELASGARRHRRRPRRRLRPGEGQRRADAGRQRRRGRRLRHLRARAGRAAPLHRVHAARRR